MKFIVAFAAVALLVCGAFADVSELNNGYDYPAPHHEEVKSEPIVAPQNTYIPPAPVAPAPAPVNTYVPPAVHEEVRSEPIVAPQNTYIPPAAPVHDDIQPVAEDGYRYKTVRRVVYRHRA